jgi:hypothetical protein
MKLFNLVFVFAFALAAHGADGPHFSAFSVGDELHVTVLGDSCNEYSGHLEVAPSCKEGRPNKNRVRICTVDLHVTMTEMPCRNHTLVPRTMTLSLDQAGVAKEAVIMNLSYNGNGVEIWLDR